MDPEVAGKNGPGHGVYGDTGGPNHDEHAHESGIRELDRRTSDGIDVRLLWNSLTGQVLVAVHDGRTGDSFELQVPGADALLAFHHPYAYAEDSGTDQLLAA